MINHKKRYLLSRRFGKDGITLMEVVIASALLSVISVTIVSIFTSVMTLYDRGNNIMDSNKKALITLARIEKELINSLPYGNWKLQGAKNEIEFYTMRVIAIGDNTQKRPISISYFKMSDENDGIFKCESYPNSPARDTLKICDNIDYFTLAYALKDTSGNIIWMDNWKDSHLFPAAVDIKLGFKSSERDCFQRIIYLPLGDNYDNEHEQD
jgi:hypothetical protein